MNVNQETQSHQKVQKSIPYPQPRCWGGGGVKSYAQVVIKIKLIHLTIEELDSLLRIGMNGNYVYERRQILLRRECPFRMPRGCYYNRYLLSWSCQTKQKYHFGHLSQPISKNGEPHTAKKKKKETREEKNLDKNSPSENPHFKLYAGDLGCPDRSFPVTLMLFPLS